MRWGSRLLNLPRRGGRDSGVTLWCAFARPAWAAEVMKTVDVALRIRGATGRALVAAAADARAPRPAYSHGDLGDLRVGLTPQEIAAF